MTRRARLSLAVIVISWLVTADLKVGATPDVAQGSTLSDLSRSPTFSADIAPLVYGHCVVCHRPGQSAPFSLISYDDVKKRGELIVKVTSRRYIPPWHATPAPYFPEFRDDRRLSEVDLAVLKAWVDIGMPAGDLARTPEPPVFPEGWALGKPDAELAFPQIIDVPADGPDLYRNIVLPLDLPEDRWITAVDFEPSARKVVHHALFFLIPSEESAAMR
jgi:hypothetical protein